MWRDRCSVGEAVTSVRWMTWMLMLIAVVVVAIWLRSDSTIYAPGYSWREFSSIRNGMTPEEVTRILGQPLSIDPFGGEVHWDYLRVPDKTNPAYSGDGPISTPSWSSAHFVADMSGKIVRNRLAGVNPFTRDMVGKSLDDVRKRHGSPTTVDTIPCQTMYGYSRLRNVKGEYVMLIHFSGEGRVYQIDANRIGHYCGTPGKMPRPSSALEWLEWYVF